AYLPAQRHAQRIVKLRFLAVGDRHFVEALDQPLGTRSFSSLSSFEPFLPRRIGLDVGVVVKQWKEARPDRDRFASGLEVVPVDRDLYVWGGHSCPPPDQPACDVEAERVLHRGADDASGFEGIPFIEVNVFFTELVYATAKAVEKTLRLPKNQRRG